MRIALALLAALAAAGCSTAEGRKTVTPEVQIVVLRPPRVRPLQADYRLGPEEAARLAGSGGTGR